ncbi:hypothetical protein [Streptacidiphilus cavernicola]|uniref:Uncharacterized protein n=1 Tax=Streptacidiphilus cavernicola TaxID=3342716 RepID=A0ABV6VYH3_9ACTN
MTAEDRYPFATAPGDQNMEALMLGVLTCLCEALSAAGRAVCCCMWFRGAARPPMDGCDCSCSGEQGEGQGVAWIRWISTEDALAYTTNRAVAARGFGAATCAATAQKLRVTFELGIYRCVTAGDPESGPDCGEQTQAAADGAWDDRLLRDTAHCCPALAGRAAVMLRQESLGPSGGCGGSVATFTADLVLRS